MKQQQQMSSKNTHKPKAERTKRAQPHDNIDDNELYMCVCVCVLVFYVYALWNVVVQCFCALKLCCCAKKRHCTKWASFTANTIVVIIDREKNEWMNEQANKRKEKQIQNMFNRFGTGDVSNTHTHTHINRYMWTWSFMRIQDLFACAAAKCCHTLNWFIALHDEMSKRRKRREKRKKRKSNITVNTTKYNMYIQIDGTTTFHLKVFDLIRYDFVIPGIARASHYYNKKETITNVQCCFRMRVMLDSIFRI